MSKRVLSVYREPDRVPPYRDALLMAGLEPVFVPSEEWVSLKGCRGLLLMGGIDIDPELYGQAKQSETDTPDVRLDEAEILAVREALDDDLPIFAICRGLQLLNVCHGGTLIQHLVPPERHRQKNGDRSLPVHQVTIEPGTLLSSIAGTDSLAVNSRHHQAVKTLGKGLRASAFSVGDGIVEAIERPDKRFVLAVQWHPEDQVHRDTVQLSLFQRFAVAIDG